MRTAARFARTASFAAAALMFSASLLAAQATGKVEGRVRDNTGQAIANAQVFIVGTAFSALTNAQGYYFINNVPVGSVDMRSAFVGYRPVVARGVLVRGGQTSTQDFALEASVVEVQAIEVTAEKPLVPRDQVTSKPIVSGELTDQLPADRVNSVLALQPGVVASSNSSQISIRGGRSDENITYIDGVPVQAGNRGGAFTGGGTAGLAGSGVSAGQVSVPTNGFSEATITTGASAAEFGNAQSGVISLETKTGGSAFKGNFGFETDGFAGVRHNNSLGFNRVQAGVNGPIANNLTFSVSGALEGQQSVGTGKDPEVPLYTPAGLDTIMAVPNTDALVDTSYVPVSTFAVFRGNCDDIQSNNTQIKNNYGVDCQGVRAPRTASSNYSVVGKLNYTFGAGNRVTLSSNLTQNQGRNSAGYATGAYTQQLNPAQANGFRNVNNVYTVSGNFNLNRSAERALALEAYLSYQTDQTLGSPLTTQSEIDSRDPFMGFMIAPLDFRFNFDNFQLNDQLLNNFRSNTPGSRRSPYDLENTAQYAVVDQYRNNPYGLLGWSESGGPTSRLNMYKEGRTVGRVGLDWQADRFNRVKVGGDFTLYDMNYYSHTLTSQAFSDVWHEKPTRYSGFMSDRLDLGDVVVDLGLRYDWYKTGASRTFLLDTFATSATNGQWVYYPRISSYGKNDPTLQKQVEDKSHGYLSPHIQVAFPVTQKTNFRLSYAHQVQAPDFGTMLTGINTDLAITNSNHVYGSDLDFGKTITFEFGVRHEFNPDMVLDISAYNKDKLADASARLISLYDPARGANNDIRLFTSADFGNVRGIDMQLQRRFGNLFTGQVSYTFQDAKNTGSDPYTYINFGSRIVDVLSGGNAQPPQAILPTASSRTHTVAGVMSLNFPDGWNQGTAVGTVLQNFGVNAIFRYTSGTPYTACPNNQNESNIAFDGNGGSACSGSQADQASDANGVRLPAFKQLDMRFTKGFAIRGVDLTAYVDARNILNLTNVLQVFQGTRDVRNSLEANINWANDSSGYADEAIRSGQYDKANGNIDLSFGGNLTDVRAGCGAWVTASNQPSPVNCVYLIRAEERFGDGDHIFTLEEQRRASTSQYLVNRGLNNFYGAPRRLRLGLEINF
ncbi:MAG: TonB-dependent receptor [Gemmatimonadetes bacterium]|nr:TonB-dependent receptor [Gemmatimonadota bacterium]